MRSSLLDFFRVGVGWWDVRGSFLLLLLYHSFGSKPGDSMLSTSVSLETGWIVSSGLFGRGLISCLIAFRGTNLLSANNFHHKRKCTEESSSNLSPVVDNNY